MGARMRATNHHGRIGTTKHNSRCFNLDDAPHIDQTKTPKNRYWFAGCTKGKYGELDPASDEFREALEASELRFYKRKFGRALELQNERYKKDRHPERCRTMEQVIQAKNKQPVETILQIGDCDDRIDPKVFTACVREYIKRLRDWSKDHGDCYKLINYAIHIDEASPHAHLRGTFMWLDEYGVAHMGQDEALKRAGVDLPDPSMPKSRYNNRKMTFDRMLRDWWIEIAEHHGYEIEKEPIKGAEALPVKAYKQKKEAEKAIKKAEEAIKEERARVRVEQMAVSGERQIVRELMDELEVLKAKYEKELAAVEKEGDPLVAWAKKRKLNQDGLTVWDLYQKDMERQQGKRQAAVSQVAQKAQRRGIVPPRQGEQQSPDFGLV